MLIVWRNLALVRRFETVARAGDKIGVADADMADFALLLDLGQDLQPSLRPTKRSDGAAQNQAKRHFGNMEAIFDLWERQCVP